MEGELPPAGGVSNGRDNLTSLFRSWTEDAHSSPELLICPFHEDASAARDGPSRLRSVSGGRQRGGGGAASNRSVVLLPILDFSADLAAVPHQSGSWSAAHLL